MPFIQSFEVRKGSLPHLLRRSPLAEGAKSKCAIKRQVQLICTCLLFYSTVVGSSCSVGGSSPVPSVLPESTVASEDATDSLVDSEEDVLSEVLLEVTSDELLDALSTVDSELEDEEVDSETVSDEEEDTVSLELAAVLLAGSYQVLLLSLSASLSDSVSEVSVLVTTGVVYVTTSFSPVCLATFVTVGRSSSMM